MALSFLFVVPSHAGPSPRRDAARVRAIVADMDRLARAAEAGHTLEGVAAERRLRSYDQELKVLGPASVAALGSAIRDGSHPLTMRLYAAAILGLIGDPGAYVPLREAALDPLAEPGLRSTALQAVATLRVGAREKRRVFDLAIAQDSAPASVWREALGQAAELGTDDPPAVVRAAGRRGAREIDARHAVAAIVASPVDGATLRLFDLLPDLTHWPDALGDALEALGREPRLSVGDREAKLVFTILRKEKGRPAALAARVASRLTQSEAREELERAMKRQDPQVTFEASEGLARLAAH